MNNSANKKDSQKQKILEAASLIMNQKGFHASSVSEIATLAGVKDPAIYQYFKGKEELLFSIVEAQMNKYLEFLNEHLLGIKGAENKLRKAVWCHLRFNDLNREYITLVLLECRTNLSFYKSHAYDLIRRYAGILMEILEAGVKERIFRRDVNLILVRDLIFGLMDFEAITCLVTHEISEATHDHEDIMKLIRRILFTDNETKITLLNKRERIIRSAIKEFAKNGYVETTITKIASEADVADGTVYEYFKNKEDLLLAIPEDHFRYHLKKLKGSFHIKDSARKLRRFIKYHFNLYLNDQNFLKVYLMLILLNRRFYQSRAYGSLQLYFQVFEDLIQKGIKVKSFEADTNIRVYRNMFLGVFTHMVLRWLFFHEEKGEGINKMKEIDEITRYLNRALVIRKY